MNPSANHYGKPRDFSRRFLKELPRLDYLPDMNLGNSFKNLSLETASFSHANLRVGS